MGDNILHRIEQIASNEDITTNALEYKIGASKGGVLSRAIAKGTDIQSKWLQLIVENYPRYSAAWLMAARGFMLKQTEQRPIEKTGREEDLMQIIKIQAQTLLEQQRFIQENCGRVILKS